MRKKVVIVMPAYNAAKTLRATLAEIPKRFASKIILVDDGSTDGTVALAKNLGITVFSHPANTGYGGNQKTCYWETLKFQPDVIVMLHPDYQYDARLLPKLVAPILAGEADMMIGSRIRTRHEALIGGMPAIKYFLNRIVTTIENMILGVNLSEHLSGLRAYSRKVLTTVPFQRLSNDFVFDQQFLISTLTHGFRIGEIPVPVRYHERASSIGYVAGTKFLLETFWCLFLYVLHSLRIYRSAWYE
ncbi:glycosyltransferase family 2 protein [Candidatus Gottesmanbacteria bacterium]|nr:glycosyltransferase family 2 protein [Candidatus Gottesmanbacteria bacterium]